MRLEVCGTVMWEEALVSGFLIEVAASFSGRAFGSFGVGLNRSGCAI